MQLISVDGLTGENVASHLQKYRLYLKRMQGFNSGPVSAADAATDQLFASANHYFSRPAPAAAPELHLLPYLAIHNMADMQQQQQYYHHQRQQRGHFASPTVAVATAVGFDHGFFARQQPGIHRIAAELAGLGAAHIPPLQSASSYTYDFDSGGGSSPKVLTMFPAGAD